MSKKHKKHKIDDIDLKILETLARDGKISNIDLSKRVGVSPSPCLRRVNILQSKGVIKSYHAEVDFAFLDYNLLVFASINIEAGSEEDKDRFEKALVEVKEVLEVYILSSEKDYLAKVMVKDYSDYKVVINSKLARLPFVKNIRTTRINGVIKNSKFIS